MRRLVIITLAITAVLVASSPASAARLRVYRGQTSAGTKIAFLVRVADDGRMSLKEMVFKVEMVCDDASTIEYGSGWGFGGIGHRFEGRSLTFDHAFWSEALHITGVFRPQTADGTFKNTQATLTNTEEAQLCTTGDLTWTATRVATPSDTHLSSRGAEVIHHVNKGVIQRLSHVG